MTILEALAILEAATLECKKREADTPELRAALDLLERLLPNANHETKAWVRHDSDFDILHAHPRWQRILELAT